MNEDIKPPTSWERIQRWVFRRFGVRGLIGLFFLVVAFYIYINWGNVSTLPGVAPIVEYLSRWSIPKADHDRFSVMVAHLENDANREHERMIVEALKEFEGIQVLVLDRSISLEGPVPEDMENQGHENARRYLKQSGASVLIWGTILSRGGTSIPKLYWTASRGDELKPKRYDTPLTDTQLRLPDVFWSDLAKILQLLVASRAAEFSDRTGHYIADRLPLFIARVRTLLETSLGRPGWNADAVETARLIMANALSILGAQSGKSEHLEEAVTACREALKEWTRERVPLQWAGTQNNLGCALSSLGERERYRTP